MPSTTRSQRRRQPVRTPQRSAGRPTARAVEPPDYTRDYAYVRKDLLLIALISSLLFVGMFVAYFFI